MAAKTAIAWCDHTFNIAWGCTKISPGCKNCYAEEVTTRYSADAIWGPNSTRRTFGEHHWNDPMRWNKAAQADGKVRLVFTSSMCDVYEDHPVIKQERQRLWRLIRRTPWLHWQVLTKRPERMARRLPKSWGDGWPNVWLGTSVENAKYTDRIDVLRKIPAAVRFISYEPALGPIAEKLTPARMKGLDWIIYGGESGPNYRPHEVQWARDVRKLCRKHRTAFFYKQSAARRTEMGIKLDGEIVREYPVPRNFGDRILERAHGGEAENRKAS